MSVGSLRVEPAALSRLIDTGYAASLDRDFDAELEASQVAGEDDLFWRTMKAEPEGAVRSTLSPPPVPSLVPRPDGQPPYSVVVTALGMRSVMGPMPTSAACAFVIHDGQPNVWTTLSATFIAAYDLSRREARLCEALLAGRALPEAAWYLTISRNTAKTHLARIFDQTGGRSQNALLRLLACGAHEPASRL